MSSVALFVPNARMHPPYVLTVCALTVYIHATCKRHVEKGLINFGYAIS